MKNEQKFILKKYPNADFKDRKGFINGNFWNGIAELLKEYHNEQLLLLGVAVTLKEKYKRQIEELENDLKILHQDEDFRLSDNSEWSKQLGFAEGKLSVFQNL